MDKGLCIIKLQNTASVIVSCGEKYYWLKKLFLSYFRRGVAKIIKKGLLLSPDNMKNT